MAKDRKVVYKLDVEVASGAKGTFADFGAEFKNVRMEADAAIKSVRELNQTRSAGGTRAGGGGSGGGSSGGSRSGLSSFDAGMRSGSASVAAERREREQNMRERMSAARQLANEESKALERSIMLRERAEKASIANTKRIVDGYRMIGAGAASAARSAVLFGATSEESAEKMLKMILRFEAVISLLQSAKFIGGGLEKILGQSGSAAMLAKLSGIGGRMAAGIGLGGAAAGSGAGAAALSAGAAAASAAAAPAAIIAVGATVGTALVDFAKNMVKARENGAKGSDALSRATRDTLEGFASLFDTTHTSRIIDGRTLARNEARQNVLDYKLARGEILQGRENDKTPLINARMFLQASGGRVDDASLLKGTSAVFDETQRSLASMNARKSRLQAAGQFDFAERVNTLNMEHGRLQQAVELRQKMFDLEMRTNSSGLQASKERLSLLEQELDKRQQFLKESQRERMAAAEYFSKVWRVKRARRSKRGIRSRPATFSA